MGLDGGSDGGEGGGVIVVRVVYRRSGDGWAYDVLAAQGELRHLGSGWSKGQRKDAEDSFRSQALSKGWEEREVRRERMRGAA
jgi:hypothetical protein